MALSYLPNHLLVGWSGVPASGSAAVQVMGDPWPDAGWTVMAGGDYGNFLASTGSANPNLSSGDQGCLQDPGVWGGSGTYTYRVEGFSSTGQPTEWSLPQTKSLSTLSAPTLGETHTDTSINITFTGTALTTYTIIGEHNTTDPGVAYANYPSTYTWDQSQTVGSSNSTVTFSCTGLTPGCTYHFVVSAAPSSGNWAFSRINVTTNGGVLPNSPSNLVATLTSPSTVFLHWDDNSNNETGFDIYRSDDPTFATDLEEIGTTGANVNQYTDTLPDETTTFYYRVYADSSTTAAADESDGDEDLVGGEEAPGESIAYISGSQSGVAMLSAQFAGFHLNANNGKITSTQKVLRDLGTQTAYGSAPTDTTAAQWYDTNQDGQIDGNSTATSAEYSDGTIDGNVEHTWPVSYERSIGNGWQFMTATPVLTDPVTMNGTWHIEGLTNIVGLQGYPIIFVPTVLLQGSGKLTANVVTNYPLPSMIESETMTIHWQITFNDTNWFPIAAGITTNHLFVTGGSAPAAYETVLWLACNGQPTGKSPHNQGDASGAAQTADRAVVDAVWSNFSQNATQRVDKSNAPNSTSESTMIYDHHPQPNTTAAAMLKSTAGPLGAAYGECDAWADLLVQALTTDGVSARDWRINPANTFNGFEVRAMPAQGSGAGDYTYAGVSAPFVYHVVVYVPCYSTRIYDPSYAYVTPTTASTIVSAETTYEDVNVTYNTLTGTRNGTLVNVKPPSKHTIGKKQLSWPSANP